MKWYEWGKYALINVRINPADNVNVNKLRALAISKCLVKGAWVYTLFKVPGTIIKHGTSAKELQKYAEVWLKENPFDK